MTKAWVAVIAVVAACGGGREHIQGGSADAAVDSRISSDAALDASHNDASIDAPVLLDGPIDSPIIVVDAPVDGPTTCDPLAQTGCPGGQKCTQIVDQDTPFVAHVGCAPAGAVAVGGACTTGAPGASGYDNCVGGALCVSDMCKAICDLQGGSPACASTHACVWYENVFEVGGAPIAGACDVKCDPLTQVAAAGTQTAACGSSNPAVPDRGCYGSASFSCAPVLANALTLTDRTTPPNAYTNGCAPGFMPLLYAETGSMVVTCNGLCAALETDNTAAHAGNSKGDATALGKLPTQAAAAVGNATCEIGVKGSEASSSCLFLWPYVADSAGNVPPELTPYVDTIGLCLARDHYRYDSNGDGVLDASDPTFPDCATLPPRSAATPGPYDDAADFGCQKLANSMFAVPAPFEGALLRRHDFR